ncbi:hypothetical protein E5Q_03046 [Mixia osmundae IAM 14324]|uniref:Uncharacterized protein n=1 Tax=Mixia osmundae (strain CBS 9802 / IAM 14324 / JCM 22182 / KY 12970) TaxID=764103 RepID=G7E0L9_MIXOS|nr:hypothetical protein E5Q_03046 [Mixia osmundae IAM 14324]
MLKFSGWSITSAQDRTRLLGSPGVVDHTGIRHDPRHARKERARVRECVQRFDDSLNSAIHITYRISLRSSSMREPRDPLLKVLFSFLYNFSSSTRLCEKETVHVCTEKTCRSRAQTLPQV